MTKSSVTTRSSSSSSSLSCRRRSMLYGLTVLLLVAATAYHTLAGATKMTHAYASWVQATEALEAAAASAASAASAGRAARTAPTNNEIGSTRTATAATKTTKTWASTEPGQVCHQMFPWDHKGEHLSYMVAWNDLRTSVLNATYYPDRLANESRFRNWVSDLFEFHTYERLQRSQAHPASPETIRTIWEVIRRRIEDPINNGPVRIAVMGGSVTTGRECDANPVDLPGTNEWGTTQPWCAYPNRLHILLNRVVFPNRSPEDRDKYPVFEVVNMAVQATNSEVGAMAIEYNLLPALEDDPPHIVISSYSANDAWDEEAPTFWRHQQDFVRAAQRIWPCDDHLPLVVLADDWFSPQGHLTTALANTGSVYKTASWHGLMAVMYSNVVRSASVVHSNYSDADGHPLFGSRSFNDHHLGMGFHIGQGWALFFNLVGALHDACTAPQLPPSSLPADKARNNESSPAAGLADRGEGLPSKYFGRYDRKGENVMREWDANYKFKERMCQSNSTAPTETRRDRRPPYSTSNCAYAWMVNMMTSVWAGDEVEKAVDHVLVDQRGWEVVDRRPKSGWRTNLTHANLTGSGDRSYFTIEVRNISQPVDTFTLLSLKSYGPEWADSQLSVEIRVLPGPERANEPPATVGSVEGHHAKEISVPYPHRFRLRGSGAHVGDTLRATFTLTWGTNFFVSGLAFCRSLTPTLD